MIMIANTNYKLFIDWGLQGLLVLGYGLVFGGYLEHFEGAAERVDSATKVLKQAKQTRSYYLSDYEYYSYTVPKPSISGVMYSTAHLEKEDLNMVIAGLVLSTIAAIALLLRYKGTERLNWIGMFLTVGFVQGAGLYLHSVAGKVGSMNDEDFKAKSTGYLVIIGLMNLLMIAFIAGSSVFGGLSKAFRFVLKFAMWAGFSMTLAAYPLGVQAVCEGNMFEGSLTYFKAGFSVMMIIGAFAIFTEGRAAAMASATAVSDEKILTA